MRVFESHKNPLNQSHWVQVGPLHATASGMPGQRRLATWPEAGVTDVVTLQPVGQMPVWMPSVCAAWGMQWHHVPLSGKRLSHPDDHATLLRWWRWCRVHTSLEVPRHVVVHCSAGLHRTGMALYVLCRAQGMDQEQSVEAVGRMRGLTGHELTLESRRGEGSIVERIEGLIQGWLGPEG